MAVSTVNKISKSSANPDPVDMTNTVGDAVLFMF